MKKNGMKKVISFVIALMMMMPVMPNSIVGAEEILENEIVEQDNSLPPIIEEVVNEVTTEAAFTVEHYLNNSGGDYTIEETQSLIGTVGGIVKDDDFAKEFVGFEYISGTIDEVTESEVTEDGAAVLKLYYNEVKANEQIAPKQLSSPMLMAVEPMSVIGPYYSEAGVMDAMGQSTNNHLIGYMAWIEKDTHDLYIAFNASDTAVNLKNLEGVIYNDVSLYGSKLNYHEVINNPLVIDGVPYTYPTYNNWLVINFGQQTLSDPFTIGLDYKENGFDALGSDSIIIYIEDYTVTYNANGGTGSMTDNNNPYEQYDTVNVLHNEFDYAGHYFVKWNTKADGTGTSYMPGNTFSMPKGDVVLYAIWSLKPVANYTVQHYTQKGDFSSFELKDSETFSGEVGSSVNASAKTYTGYTFDNSISGTVLSGTITSGGGLILKLYYTANPYNVYYEGNGNTGGTAPTDLNNPYVYNENVTVLGNGDLSKIGSTFNGWNTDPNGDGTAYDVEDNFAMPDDNVTLYAQWNQNKYTVTYEPGTQGTFTAQVTNNLVYGTATPTAPTATGNPGYTFTGWSPTVAATVTGNATYTATWSQDKYTVTYEPGTQGTFTAQVTNNLVYGTATPTAPTATGNPGYTFTGWSPTVAATVTGNATYTATWSQDKYTVTYEPGTQGTFTTQTTNNLIYGDATPTAPTATGNPGYTFTGWSPTVAVTVTGNATYTAQWAVRTDISYTVNYLEQETNIVLEDAKVVTSQTFGTNVTESAIDIAGYDKVEPTSATITLAVSGNVINFYYTEQLIDINVQKIWADDQQYEAYSIMSSYKVKPTITIRLFADGVEVDSTTLSDGTTSHTFADKPKYSLNGELGLKEIEYVVKEDSVTGYENIISSSEDGDFYVEITNTLIDYNLTYNANGGRGTTPNAEIYNYGDDVTVKSNMFTRSNYEFKGWNTAANGSGTNYAVGALFTMPANSVTLYAQWRYDGDDGDDDTDIPDPDVPLAELEKFDHFAYVIGYPEGDVRPLNNITREEVAMIFYRLLTDESRNSLLSDANTFTDMENHDWSNRAISTLYNAGIVKGYPDGTFGPSKPITRAEFATIASKFDKLELNGTTKFTDIFGHWAEKYITSSEIKGWIKGYPDLTFKPEQDIRRAEAMTLINNVLGRIVPEENIHPAAMTWYDNPVTEWYYEAVMEATNSHDYIYEEDKDELWTGLKANKVWP